MQVLALVKVSPTVLQTAAAVLCSTSAPETVQVLDIRELPLPGPLEISLLADALLTNGTRNPSCETRASYHPFTKHIRCTF